MNLQDFQTLFDYHKWATDRALEAASSLPEGLYLKDLGSSHGGIHGTLVHIYAGGRIWLDRWLGKHDATLTTARDIGSLESLKKQWAILRMEQEAFFQGLTEEKLQSAIRYTDTKGYTYSSPLYQLIHQVLNHSTYHRGQIASMLRQLGVKPPNTDLINYYRKKSQ